MSAIVGPIAPESNPPINPQFYAPSRLVISNVTLGQTTTVTTTANNDYYIGQEVRLLIPNGYGCVQLNETSGLILSLPSANQAEIEIDSSRNVDPYVAAGLAQVPQILPLGDINSGVKNSSGRTNTGTFIPGSFINISPL